MVSNRQLERKRYDAAWSYNVTADLTPRSAVNVRVNLRPPNGALKLTAGVRVNAPGKLLISSGLGASIRPYQKVGGGRSLPRAGSMKYHERLPVDPTHEDIREITDLLDTLASVAST